MKQPQGAKIQASIQELRQRIQQGYYAAGSRLPGERNLAKALEVSRMTIRTVLQRLQEEGLLEIVPNSGVYVCPVVSRLEIGPWHPLHSVSLVSFGKEVKEERLTYQFEPSTMQQADLVLAQKLGIKEGTELVHRTMLVLRNQRFVRFVKWLVPQAMLLQNVGLLQWMTSSASYSYLEQWLGGSAFGTTSSAYERFVCRLPTPQEASYLSLSRSQSLVEVERWIWQEPGILGMYALVLSNAALHSFTYAYSATQWPLLMRKILDES